MSTIESGSGDHCRLEHSAGSRPADWQYVQMRLADIRFLDDLPIEDRQKWIWVRLFADARTYNGRVSKQNLHKRLKITPKTCEKTMEIFEKFGLIVDEGDWYAPRYWETEQSSPKPKSSRQSGTRAQSSTERSRSFRARQRATCNATGTERPRPKEIDQDNIHYLDAAPSQVATSPRPPAQRRCRLAPDAQPSRRDLEAAAEFGLDDHTCSDEWDHFRSHHVSKGNSMACWYSAWRTWLRNYNKGTFNKRSSSGQESNFTKAARKLIRELEGSNHEDCPDAIMSMPLEEHRWNDISIN